MNNAAVNTVCVCVFFHVLVSFPFNGISGSYSSSTLYFWGTFILFPNSSIYISISSVQGFPSFTFSSILVISCLFDDSHSNKCEVISHMGFDLHFSDDQWCWAPFYVPIGYMCLLWKNVYSDLLPILTGFFCLLPFEFYEFFIHYGYQPLIQYILLKYFLPFCMMPFHFIYFTEQKIFSQQNTSKLKPTAH